MKKLTIIMPAFNEAETIGPLLERIKTVCFDIAEEIVVIDDGSSDETGRIARQAGVYVIHHNTNKGYGSSIKEGIRYAKTDFILTIDSDGQHKVEDILSLWKLAEKNDMVVGKRTNLISGPLWRMPGKYLLRLIANYLVRFNIPDLNSGLRVIKRDVALKYLRLCPSGFSFSTTITLVLLNRGHNVSYVPIQVKKRKGKSTVSISTGLDTIILILRIITLFNPLRIFVPASLILGIGGILWSLPYLFVGRGISVGSMLAVVTAILLFGLGLLCDQISQLRLERFE